MAPKERDNYFKLVALIVDIACDVIWKYIKEKILSPLSFESFLNLKEEKHKLVHAFENLKCCECVPGLTFGERLISKQQLLLLYKSDETKQIQSHKRYVHGRVSQFCICKYYAIKNIDVKVVDVTLANYIFQKCGKNEQGLDNWMTQIKQVRNEIFHLSDIKQITDDEFSRKWEMLKGSILGIANKIDSTYAAETENKILHTKQLIVIPAYMLNYEILCCHYWRDKCAEFERTQIEDIEKNAKALHAQFPELFSESMEMDFQTTLKGIQYIRTAIDNINILIKILGNEKNMEISTETELSEEDIQIVHVPAFLQIKVPASWDETRVFDCVNELRLSGSSDVNLRIMAISRDDLKMYTEIARTVLRNIDLLKTEVKAIISGMLSKAAIDSKQNADVTVNLTIASNPEECNEKNIDDEKDKTECNAKSIDNAIDTKECNAKIIDDATDNEMYNKKSIHDAPDKTDNNAKSTDDATGINKCDGKSKDDAPDTKEYNAKSTDHATGIKKCDAKSIDDAEDTKEYNAKSIDDVLDTKDNNAKSTDDATDKKKCYAKSIVDATDKKDNNAKNAEDATDKKKCDAKSIDDATDLEEFFQCVNDQDDEKATKTKFVVSKDIQLANLTENIEHKDIFPIINKDETRKSTDYEEPIRPPRLNKPIEVTVSLSCKIKAHNDWRRWFFVLINTTSLIEIPGCAIVEGKFVVLLDQQSAKVLIYNIDGSFNRDIRLSGKPQRLSIIDDNLVAISYNRLFIELIIIKTGELSMKIFTNAHSLDIAFQNGHLFIVEDMGKIEVTDIRGIIMRTIHCPSSSVQYIATDKNMMFLSDSKNNSLYCCDFNGSVIWKFVNPLMEYPCGVTTDGSCNVYVTCHKSSNVFVVSSHGKQHQVLLCEKEQHSPSGIYYDKTNNRLLVCSMSNRNVFLYNVNHAANGQKSLSDASN